MFENNTPLHPSFVSLRRNIVCLVGGRVDVVSLAGGDGAGEEESMWMVSKSECEFEGLAIERSSAFFIPLLENASASLNEYAFAVVLHGKNLLPCNIELNFVIRNADGITMPHTRYYVSSSDTDSTTSLTIPSLRFQYMTEEERRRMGVCVRYSDYLGNIHESPYVPMNLLEEVIEEEELRVIMGLWATVMLVGECVGLSLLLIVLLVIVYLFHGIVAFLKDIKWRNFFLHFGIIKKNEENLREELRQLEELRAQKRSSLIVRDYFITPSPNS
jgi:hypothetical protein